MTSTRNEKAFIAFRVFFNCRFYYPIFAILFLDFGLSLEQFSLLNVAWAISIVLGEVPSGALADLVGRKKLIIYAAILMVLEMCVLLFSPRVSPLVFYLFLLNRILSGLAEASASGADEALTYDSLEGTTEEVEEKWNDILSRTMKYQSIGMTIVMLLGAFLYGWNSLNKWFPWWGDVFSRDMTLRLPIALNLLTALLCLFTATQFEENKKVEALNFFKCKSIVKESFQQVFDVAKWIFKSRFVFSFILFCVVFDSSFRMFVTVTSRFYRYLGIADVYFGPIGAALAFLGVFSGMLGKKIVKKFNVKTNFALLFVLTIIPFISVLMGNSLWQLISVVLVTIVMNLVFYFLSYYLNREAPSKIRATLLSYKGLAINLTYAWVGVVYAWEARRVGDVFEKTLPFYYKYFLTMFFVVLLIQFLHKRFLKQKNLI